MSPSASLKSLYIGTLRRLTVLDWSWPAAMLVLPLLKTVKPAQTGNAPTVVILPKEGFTEDVMTALTPADALNVVALPRVLLREMARAHLPYFIDDNNYLSAGPEYNAPKARYRRFLVRLFRTIRRFRRIDGIISGSFSYAPERELAAAARELGLPFIALHKENLKTPGRVDFFERIYRERRGPFSGRKVLVYNAIERDLQIRAGVAEPGSIEIVGMPRLDRMHAWRLANAGSVVRNRILFFVFSSTTGMPRVPRKTPVQGRVYFEEQEAEDGHISLASLTDQTCKTLLRIAQEHPDIEIVVKSKGRRRDYSETAPLFGFELEAQLPPNMRVVHGGDVMNLIAEASVVCGFNSTALLEAVAAGKPVVMPWFAEAELEEALPYLIDLREVSAPARSPEQLHAELVRLARRPPPIAESLSEDAARTLAGWTGNDDGGAARRTRDAILQVLARGSSP
jgi:hypothetical protein